MSLHLDLLRQARHLATREPRRPSQASLRRSVSTAYYALFHLLVDEAVRRMVVSTRPPRLSEARLRSWQHDEGGKDVCEHAYLNAMHPRQATQPRLFDDEGAIA